MSYLDKAYNAIIDYVEISYSAKNKPGELDLTEAMIRCQNFTYSINGSSRLIIDGEATLGEYFVNSLLNNIKNSVSTEKTVRVIRFDKCVVVQANSEFVLNE